MNADDITLDSLLANTTRFGECMVWNGTITVRGHPQIAINKKRVLVTRLVAALVSGKPIKKDRAVVHVHSCRYRACINPAHLNIVRHQDAWRYRKSERTP